MALFPQSQFHSGDLKRCFKRLCHRRSCLSGEAGTRCLWSVMVLTAHTFLSIIIRYLTCLLYSYHTEINERNMLEVAELLGKQISVLQILCILIIFIIVNLPKFLWQGPTWVIMASLCKFSFSELCIVFFSSLKRLEIFQLQTKCCQAAIVSNSGHSTFLLYIKHLDLAFLQFKNKSMLRKLLRGFLWVIFLKSCQIKEINAIEHH